MNATQPTLLDDVFTTAYHPDAQDIIRRRRDHKIARARVHAGEEWTDMAIATIAAVARALPTFTAADVWDALERDDVPQPTEPRAMGAAMQRAAREGIIRSTGDWRVTTRKECNGRPQCVWQAGANSLRSELGAADG